MPQTPASGRILGKPNQGFGVILRAMHWPVGILGSTMFLFLACGGPAAPLPQAHGRGGSGGMTTTTTTTVATGGTLATSTGRGGATGRAGSGTGGVISTYVDPGCPNVVTPQMDAQCDVFDQTTCSEGKGCYPGIHYPSAPCQPETYGMYCLWAGSGVQWDPCQTLTDCAPGYVCVVGGTGTDCERACDTSDPASCPKGLFCSAIDLPGIGTCY
jgi:hypothetical protein